MKEIQARTARRNKLKAPVLKHLQQLLEESAIRHQHLCPRQVLGARIGLYGLRALGFIDYGLVHHYVNQNKRLLTIVETDGCAADGLAVAVDCSIGRRTLRVLDFGKVAATLVDVATGRAVRVAPSPNSRELAQVYAPDAPSRWHAYRIAYQLIPDHELLIVQEVQLTTPLAQILSKPEARSECSHCGEEIINEREVVRGDRILCRPCAGEGYYQRVQGRS